MEVGYPDGKCVGGSGGDDDCVYIEVNDEYVDSNEKDTNTEKDVLDDDDDYCYHHDGMLLLQVPKEKDINVAG
eukprot:5257663-Ditylum_brightwellii.AAC.1